PGRTRAGSARRLDDEAAGPAPRGAPGVEDDAEPPSSDAYDLERVRLTVRVPDRTSARVVPQGACERRAWGGRGRSTYLERPCAGIRAQLRGGAVRHAAPEGERAQGEESRRHPAARASSVAREVVSCRRTRVSLSRLRRLLRFGAAAMQPFSPRTFAA